VPALLPAHELHFFPDVIGILPQCSRHLLALLQCQRFPVIDSHFFRQRHLKFILFTLLADLKFRCFLGVLSLLVCPFLLFVECEFFQQQFLQLQQ
jgi:hypothetical protein